MSFTNYLEAKLLDHVFGGATMDYEAPTTMYLGLATDVAEDGTVTGEPSGNNYARVEVTNNGTNWPAATAGSKASGAVFTFPEASGTWGTLDTFFISDDPTAGNILAYGALSVEKTIGDGDQPKFNTGNITITLD